MRFFTVFLTGAPVEPVQTEYNSAHQRDAAAEKLFMDFAHLNMVIVLRLDVDSASEDGVTITAEQKYEE